MYTWEELCREWLLRAAAQGELPFIPDRVGSTWNAAAQVDVVGIHRGERTLILGECKWTPGAVDRRALSELVDKASRVVPLDGLWRVYFLGFSRSGWNTAARDYCAEITAEGVAGVNWRSTGMRLLDLEQVDADLEAWS